MKWSRACTAAVAMTIVPLTPYAYAHGDLRSTSPRNGARVPRPPNEVTITLTEAPAPGAQARATDGCDRRVPGAVSVDGDAIVLSLEGGEAGRWNVSYSAVSSVDGHRTRGRIGFTVSGDKDCTSDREDIDIDAGDEPGIIQNPDPPDDSSTQWIWWVVGGTVALGALALLIRRAS